MANFSLSTTLTTWHKRLGHTNFIAFQIFLHYLKIPFVNHSKDYICDSCKRSKTTKVYNCESQKCAQWPYQFVHTDLIGPINPVGFLGKWYFFTFTNNFKRPMETSTANKKSDWLKCLNIYYSLCKTRFKEEYPIERLRSDYRVEL